MRILFEKLFFTITFNLCLFFLLIIGIQNSSNKSKVYLLVQETVALPISFIIGSSFISGSITGSLIGINVRKKK